MFNKDPYIKAYLKVIKESVGIEKNQIIANEIGGEYIPETNTIDCKGNKVKFKREWLTNGTFDFKLINTSNNWSEMFYNCRSLTHLPEDFIIPKGVTNCEAMFLNCINLKYLPTNFIIPESVTNCEAMFYCCMNLMKLPDNFNIPDSVTNYKAIFYGCYRLPHLNFHIPENILRKDYEDEDEYEDEENEENEEDYQEQCHNYEVEFSNIFSKMLEKYKINLIKEIIDNVNRLSSKPFLSDIFRGDKKFIKNGIINPCEFIDGSMNLILNHPEKWPEFKEYIKRVNNMCPEEYESWALAMNDNEALEFIAEYMCNDGDNISTLCEYLKELNLTIPELENYFK